jgi:hypothetical protein
MGAARDNPSFSRLGRRGFLKLLGAGAFGLALPARLRQQAAGLQQGRVIVPRVSLYEKPSFASQEVNRYWRDTVLEITHVTIGDPEPAHNRVWYRLGTEGYAHSGEIQPVQTSLNPPVAELPKAGALGEITVPYTDAHRYPGKEYDVAYRYYYETTHWVTRLVHDRRGEPWYKVVEDKWEYTYFVYAPHMRILPLDELAPLSPEVPIQAKRLEVRLAEQAVIAYEWERPVFMTRAATGAEFSNGKFATPGGRHYTFHKRPSRHMAAGNLAANGYDLPGVPWVTYITESGIAFHGTYWHNDFGRPRSHGCINLTSQASRWIYRWTLPSVPPTEQRVYEDYGTAVDVI